MKKTSFIALILLISGCGSSLDNTWTNFTAYYNTYYNAKEDFKTGLSKVEEQSFEINPDSPVRPHPTPPLAGEQDFENAVENAAQILRRFPESKWTDDALLLMGKSYYYLKEYFLARQKFEELLALPYQTTLKQQAVIWKGRTLLDIQSYAEGVQFLDNSLSDFAGNWIVKYQAETQILLAEHQTMLEHWEDAAALLEPSIARIEDSALRGRSYFLLGQLFQRMNNFNLAFQAYSNVKQNFPNYEYIYWAEIKRAEMARIQDNVDLAISIYTKMLNDDKNVDRRSEINYQLARAYEVKGNLEESERIFKQVLGNNTKGITQELRSDTYYQLGELYSKQYQNYKLAAAYFDSSSFEAQQRLEDADKLASAYNRYISLKQQITRIDSLLALGTLNKSELQTRLAEIRQQRREQLRESQNAIRQANNTLSNVDSEDIYDSSAPEDGTSGFGFLNYKNAALVQQERRQFRAVWGGRPLVDNWRRAEAMSGTNISEEQPAQPQDSLSVLVEADLHSDKQLGINLSDVPRSEEAKNKLKKEALNVKYRLGSLFFLTLEQPDSAAYYYQRVLRDSSSTKLRVQTLYSLYELYNIQNQPDSTAKYQEIVLRNYPNSIYAKRIADAKNNNQPDVNLQTQDSAANLNARLRGLMEQEESANADSARAKELYNLAVNNRTSSLAPAIFVESIREYIQFAKAQGSDSTATDSLGTIQRDSVKKNVYMGSHWDRVRSLLAELKGLFPNAPQVKQVGIWANMLEKYEQKDTLMTCNELGIKPVFNPGKKKFIASIVMPEKTRDMNLSGSIQYRIIITKKGDVESYELISNPTNLRIEEAYEEAMKDSLQFEPVMQNGQPVRVSCEVEFPIKQ